MNFLKPMALFDVVTPLDSNVIMRTGTASNPFPIRLASSYQREVPPVAQGALLGKRLSDSTVRGLLQEFKNPLNERTFRDKTIFLLLPDRGQSNRFHPLGHSLSPEIHKAWNKETCSSRSIHPHALRHTAIQKTTDTSGKHRCLKSWRVIHLLTRHLDSILVRMSMCPPL
jgi:hypothetical protein